jgi:hypothetical protein
MSDKFSYIVVWNGSARSPKKNSSFATLEDAKQYAFLKLEKDVNRVCIETESGSVVFEHHELAALQPV